MTTLELLLQSIDLDTLSRLRTASELVSFALGLVISYLAYLGYRRNQSRPMLFIALGFALILGVPGVALVILGFGLDIPIPIVNSVGQVSELAGLLAILYGLWMPRRP
ncbi:hypothetical protein SAMN05444422_109183 [Halobiforma haloterrestris]|uniref:Uncharacterized protein n=1 Tax=Natronobacterium haloterrestre TaxID=148448 RepID=A0A1I1K0Y6_NATHA|nr:hypothetical protein [Halobiforma haloterrestris]SFC51643.1 hypothetical protein SAMN05444422_109183 [Halobiforma haloterrestris]